MIEPGNRLIRRPNILLITSDQQRADCYGFENPVLRTPHLDRLARDEVQARAVAYSEWHVHPARCGVGLKLRTVRTRTHKCSFELGSGAGELYNLSRIRKR